MKFAIRLKKAHDATGLTYYAVWKATGVAQNTVSKYVAEDIVIADRIEPPVIRLAEFYGLNWRDSSVIDIVREDAEDSGEKNRLPHYNPQKMVAVG